MSPVYSDEVIGRMTCCDTMSPAPDGVTYHDPECFNKKSLMRRKADWGVSVHRFSAAGYEKYRLIDRPATPDPDLPTWTGWVSPEGVFYGCEYAGHRYLARRIVLALMPDSDVYSPGDLLESMGWVQTHGANWKEKAEWMIYILQDHKLDKQSRHKPTRKQLDTLFDLAVKFDNMKCYDEFIQVYASDSDET